MSEISSRFMLLGGLSLILCSKISLPLFPDNRYLAKKKKSKLQSVSIFVVKMNKDKPAAKIVVFISL